MWWLGLKLAKGFEKAGAGIMDRVAGRGDGAMLGWRLGRREAAVEAVLSVREGVRRGGERTRLWLRLWMRSEGGGKDQAGALDGRRLEGRGQ